MKTECLRYRKHKHIYIKMALFFSFLIVMLSLGTFLLLAPVNKFIKGNADNSSYSIDNYIALKQNTVISDKFTASVDKNMDCIYLSDMAYMDISSTAYSTIKLDKNLEGNLISLLVNGRQKMFMKGVFAHANATLAYDLTGYDFDYLTAYLGVDAGRGNIGNGVRFEIHTSEDGKNWKLQERVNNNAVFKGNTESYFLQYPVKGVKYIKFVIRDCGNNSNDHSVLADAKLIKEGYEQPAPTVDFIKTVEEYDKLIKNFPSSTLTAEQELILLQRNFVDNADYDLLQNLATFNSTYGDTLKWLMTDLANLKLYVMGGKPTGSYYNSINALTELYQNYRADWEIKDISKNGVVLGDLYKKMAITLSLTHSAKVALWMQPSAPENQSTAVVRYAIFKSLYDNGGFVVSPTVDITPWFETYTVEEMRFIMNNIIDDESILWLHDYTQKQIDAHPNQVWTYLTPHPYMAYVWPNYANPVFHDQARKEYWDQKYDGIFSKYGVTYSTESNMVYKVWMNFRNEFGTGAVCGGISKTGSNIRTVHGIPAAVIGQPGHAAIIFYSRNAEGKGYWGIDNDVSGWTLSEKGERMLLGWGNDRRYVSGYNVPYMVMAQEAINRFDEYQRSAELLMLADTYQNDPAKREAYLREAIGALDFNVDAWYALIDLYKNDDSKTEEDFYNLAKEMSGSLLEFPVPFYNLMKQLESEFTSTAYRFTYSLLLTNTLKSASTYNGTEVLQPSVTRVEASYLLGQTDPNLATFSFDGDNANNIVLSSRFDGNGVRWDYSLDGKQTWKEVSFSSEEPHKWLLTPEEVASITSANDIYVHIVGVNYADENLFKIDIKESAGLPSTLYANDFENRLIAAIPTMMWKYNETDNWKYYKDEIPDLSGEKDIIVKAGATGLYLASNDQVTYHFTKNTDPDTRKYISIDHLSVESVSSAATAQGRHAANIIDGNIYTNWHSAWDGSDWTKEIVIKLDEAKNLTAMDFYPLAGGNGKIEKAQIFVSMDGIDYIQVAETNWTYANTNDIGVRTIDFEPTKGQYIKIVGKKTQSANSGKSYIAGAMFNFYENKAIKLVASFSFDGANAGKITLNDSEYTGEWQYSIDGTNWVLVSGNSYQLSAKELSSITSLTGIKVRIGNDATEYSITIKEAEELVLSPYLNDLENRLIAIGDVSKLEWKYSDTTEWTSYSEKEPVVLGTRVLQVRKKALGNVLASNALEYQFTEDNQPEEAKYILIKHLTIDSFSTQSIDSKRPYYAPNVIDGNINTLWHTDFRYSVLTQDVKPYVTIKLDVPRHISALEFIQKKYKNGDPDDIKNARVYVSLDGDNWTLAGSIEECSQDGEMKRIDFDQSIYGQYVKFEVDTYGIFASAAMINLYEDLSHVSPNVSIEYSTTDKTNSSVTATLVSDKDIIITNNNGSATYTFNDNGTFTFEYVDKDGNHGEINASVTWIDKVAPTATIDYSIRDITNEDVVVTLIPSEKVTILNNNGSNKYTFTENGEFTFEFVDEAGNKGSATANVTWINKKAPTGTVSYDKKTPTNGNVTATLSVADGVTITNNNGSSTYVFTDNGTFTFEFVDRAGNRGTVTANVTWIDREAPKGTIIYSTNSITNKNVVATLITNKPTRVINNNGSDKYTFTENGEFTFEFIDEAGNKGTFTAKVNWIDKKAPSGTISYSTTNPTKGNVIATLVTDERVTITNNNGSNVYTFTENGEFTFEFIDEAGNKGSVKAVVNWIDSTPDVPVDPEEPVKLEGTLEYDIKNITNKDVTVTLTVKDGIIIKNNEGKNTYVFTENGTFSFIITDGKGNEAVIEAKVDWIDKKAPTGTISYDITNPTKGNVIATLVTDERVTITNNNGSNVYTFTENGEFTFEFIDEAGNKGSVKAVVNWIDSTPDVPVDPEEPVKLEGTLEYDIKNITNKDVTVTLTVKDGIIIKNNEGKNTYVFTENGTFNFIITDGKGNEAVIEAKVDWIDKKSPIGNVTYSIKKPTNGNVIATLVTDKRATITNNNGSNVYTFTENGEFTFEFIDEAGNKGTFTAKVDWIDKKAPIGTIRYSTTNPTTGEVMVFLDIDEEAIILNNNGLRIYTFTKNGEFTFEFVDRAGNRGSVTAKVDWIKEREPEIPEEPSNPEVPDVPSIPDRPVIPNKPSKPNKPAGDNTQSNNTGNSGNTTTTKPSEPSTTTTTNKVDSEDTTEKITVPTDEEVSTKEYRDNNLNLKVVLVCILVFVIFMITLVRMYLKK